MNLRKLNANITWLLILCLLAHMGTMTYSLLTGWYNFLICKGAAFATAGVCAVHILLSIYLVVARSGGAGVGRYKRRNIRTIVQRTSALLMLLALYPHILDFGFITEGRMLSDPEKLRILFTEIVFFGSVFTHMAVSFSKSLISAGKLRTDEAEKRVDQVLAVICSLLLLLAVYAVWQFLFLTWGR